MDPEDEPFASARETNHELDIGENFSSVENDNDTMSNSDDQRQEERLEVVTSELETTMECVSNHKNFYSIDKKFVYEFNEKFSCQQIEELGKNANFRVAIIKECKNLKRFLGRIQDDAYKTAFSKTSHLFAFVIETNEKFEDNFAFQFTLFNDTRPIIIQIMYEDLKSTIYFKESNSSVFSQITITSEISQDDYLKLIDSKLSCTLTTFFQALYSRVLGHVTGNLISMKLFKRDLFLKALQSAVKFNSLCFLVLKLFDTATDVDLPSLFETITYEAKPNLLALLDLPFTISQDESDFEILMACVKSNNVELLGKLLNHGFDVSCHSDHVKIALVLKFFECASELIEADSSNPTDVDIAEIILNETSAQKFRETIESKAFFHDAVRLGNIKIVKNFINGNPRWKYVYDLKNKSVVTVALESRKFEIYSLLLSRGFSSGIDDIFDKAMNELSQKDKLSIREMNKRYFKACKISYLYYLFSKTKLSHDIGNSEYFFEVIGAIYAKLNEMPEVEPILRMLENIIKFQIIFNFTKLHVMDMDPMADKRTSGIIYPGSGYIYVAAKNHEEKFLEIVGTLAHELMHFAMKLVYDNDCKPYSSIDAERENNFEKISENLRQHCDGYPEDTNCIISSVFECYPKERWHAELIVRVPQLSAVLFENQESLVKLKQGYCEKLFNFFENLTLKDITSKIDLLKPQAEILEINNIIGLLKKVRNYQFRISEAVLLENQILISDEFRFIVIGSNFSFLTLSLTFQLFCKKFGEHLAKEIIFADDESIQNLSEKIEGVCKSKSGAFLIVKAEHLDNLEQMLDDLKLKVRNGKVIVITTHENCDSIVEKQDQYKCLKLTHTYEDLDEDSKGKLLQREIVFQGYPVKLENLLPPNSETFMKLPLQNLLCDKLVIENIMQESKNSILQGFYIERKFIVQKVREKKQNICEEEARKEEISSQKPQIVSVKLNCDELLQEATTKKILIISDVAGMGKSTTLNEIAKIVKLRQRTHWVSFIDLKQYIEKFQQIQESENTEPTLSEILLIIIDKVFDQEIFLTLYQAGKVTIFLDGFDEISPFFNHLIMSAVKQFNVQSGNQLWITTRTHLKIELEQELNQVAYSLVPLSRDDQIKIVMEFWKSKQNSDLSVRQELAINLIDKLSNNLSESGSDLMGIPLQVRMIAEIYESEPKEMKTFNLYSIYEAFIRKIIRTWMLEKGELSFKDQENIYTFSFPALKIHELIALFHLFGSNFTGLDYKREEWSKEMLARIGIIHFDGVGDFHFIHETFAEFFVSQFIINNLKSSKLSDEIEETMIELLCIVLIDQKYQKIRMFLDKALEKLNDEGKICCDSLKRGLEEKDCKQILLNCILEQLEHLLGFLLKAVKSFDDKELKKDILKYKTLENQNMIMLSYKMNLNKRILESVWKVCRDELNNPELGKMILDKDIDGKNVLHHLIIANSEDLLGFTMIVGEVFLGKELKLYFNEKTDNGRNILSLLVEKVNREFLNSFWTFYRSVYSFNELRASMLDTDKKGLNALHIASYSNNEEVISEYLNIFKSLFNVEELESFIQMSSDRSNNILHFAAMNKNNGILTAIYNFLKSLSLEHSFKSMLQNKNCSGVNVLQLVIVEKKEKDLLDLINILPKVFTHKNFNSFLKEEEIINGRNILCLVAGNLDKACFDSFWTLLRNFLNANELKILFLQPDHREWNALHLASHCNSGEVVTAFFCIMQNLLSSEELESFIQMSSEKGYNILHLAAMNKNKDILTTIWSCLKSLSMEHVKNNDTA